MRLTLLLLALTASAPFVPSKTIRGSVFSDKDSTAIAGAVCRLLTDNTFQSGTTTDSEGSFILKTETKTHLSLEITMTGFNATEIIIESGTNDIDLGRVYLSGGVTLDEVTVTANAQMDIRGRTIIYPATTDVKASPTSISLFQKLPLAGLEANPINRSLSVDGGTPMILINGVPSTITDFNALQPKDIAKIEFSRITPARYADKGYKGFLSITLKERTDGGQIYAWTRSAVTTAFVDADIQASYHQGASQFTLSYNPSWRNYQNVYDNTTESYIGDDFVVDLEEHDRNPFYYAQHTMRLKYDYSPNVNTLFSATFRATPYKSKNRMIADNRDSELGTYNNYNVSTSENFSPSLDLFFRRDFNKKNALELQVVGTISSNDYRRNNTYTFADGREEDYTMNVDSRRRSLISEVSYTHQFSDKTSLSAGYQNTFSHSKNTYLTSDYQPVLTENNNYVYARLGQQVGKVYFSVATGAKLYWIENDETKRDFVRNNSSAMVSWNINPKLNVQASFQYSPSIPSLSSLTDYSQQTTPYLISNGNPDLKSTDYFNYRLAVSYQYKKFSASFNSVFMDAKNAEIYDLTYLGDKFFLAQSVNARKYRTFQNGLWLKVSDIAGFGANLNMRLTYYESAGTGWSHDLTSFDASFTLWWNKGPFTVSYWRKFPGKYLNGHHVGKDENGDALSFTYQPNKHWTINADWMYMFEKKGTQYPSWNYSAVNPTYSERYIENNGNMVVLSVSYATDFGAIFRSARRSLNNSDNGSSLLKM